LGRRLHACLPSLAHLPAGARCVKPIRTIRSMPTTSSLLRVGDGAFHVLGLGQGGHEFDDALSNLGIANAREGSIEVETFRGGEKIDDVLRAFFLKTLLRLAGRRGRPFEE